MPSPLYATSIYATPTDTTPGWRLGPSRFLPAAFTVSVRKYVWLTSDGKTMLRNGDPLWATDDELAEYADNPRGAKGRLSTDTAWLELDVETSETQPPRCVALRAPWGIATGEQRAPIAGFIAEACVLVATADGSFTDLPRTGIEWEDVRWEARRSRGRRRTRSEITPERLKEVLRIARSVQRRQTAKVQHELGISRGYARRLIKRAEAAEAEPAS